MTLTLGFSPCPNDTFIFDALVNNKIDTEGLNFIVELCDVQTLNEWAIEGRLDITKLSYGVLPMVLDNYIVLKSGSALGKGVGPLLISNGIAQVEDINKKLVAIPGEQTTANLLFSMAFPNAKNKIFLKYNEIEQFVLENKGLGVIIHENRFTYADKGLDKIIDLGDFWELNTQNPIPLGGIVAKRNIDLQTQLKVNELIKKSIQYAYEQYPQLSNYIKTHSQEMSEDVMRKHIDLYVNNFSLNLGEEGMGAVMKLINVYNKNNGMSDFLGGDIFCS